MLPEQQLNGGGVAMSTVVRRAPREIPYKILPHLRAAFGGAFGAVNLLVGSVSIARQIATALAIGLSPVLKSIFSAYVSIFHGLVDDFASAFSFLSGYQIHVPLWAHDWIILWCVLAGSAYRVVNAANRYVGVSVEAPGVFFYRATLITPRLEELFGETTAARAIGGALTYLFSIVVWPAILIELFVLPPAIVLPFIVRGGDTSDLSNISFVAVFWLQTVAIAWAIFALSILNSRTM